MAVRATMQDLIDRMRLLIGDPAGNDAYYTDEQLQERLDQRRTEYRYLSLIPLETIGQGGGVTYLEYRAARPDLFQSVLRTGRASWLGDWEEDGTLFGADYGALSPSSSDWRRGAWTFSAHQPPPVTIVGRRYDLPGAGADALEAWAAGLKTEYDVKSGDQTLARGMQAGRLLELAAALRARQMVDTVRAIRSDAC